METRNNGSEPRDVILGIFQTFNKLAVRTVCFHEWFGTAASDLILPLRYHPHELSERLTVRRSSCRTNRSRIEGYTIEVEYFPEFIHPGALIGIEGAHVIRKRQNKAIVFVIR